MKVGLEVKNNAPFRLTITFTCMLVKIGINGL
jgi:hypothetical protein